MLLYPVEDIDQALPFFIQGLGMAIKFRDGKRFCALDGDALTIGLAAEEERVVREPAMVYKVDDIAATVERLIASGATLVRPETRGPHELRAVLKDPQGFPFILSAKLD